MMHKWSYKIVKNIVILFSLCAFTLAFFCACGNEKREEPISLTIWHVYGDQTDSPLNDLIKEFNESLGQTKGIHISATKVSDTNTLHEAVLSAAKGEPGAEELPDIFVAYPKTVLAMEGSERLVDFQNYFSKEEIGEFIDEFIEEGKIKEELKVLPVAKST